MGCVVTVRFDEMRGRLAAVCRGEQVTLLSCVALSLMNGKWDNNWQ